MTSIYCYQWLPNKSIYNQVLDYWNFMSFDRIRSFCIYYPNIVFQNWWIRQIRDMSNQFFSFNRWIRQMTNVSSSLLLCYIIQNMLYSWLSFLINFPKFMKRNSVKFANWETCNVELFWKCISRTLQHTYSGGK